MNGRLQLDNNSAEDSDSDYDAAGNTLYYSPISSGDSQDAEQLGGNSYFVSNGGNHSLDPNTCSNHLPENSIAALDLYDYASNDGSDEEDDDAIARERESSILRAFREDDSRRTAPLPPGNAARILSAMRGVTFPGYTPEWADRVPEDRWVDHLRRLRGEPTPQS
ncbi:hypothetical protein HPP92_003693 [Vanilla planifolia]|nr:hypothetical protein HPP92_003693 [Vanilla planifolia]